MTPLPQAATSAEGNHFVVPRLMEVHPEAERLLGDRLPDFSAQATCEQKIEERDKHISEMEPQCPVSRERSAGS